jgi:glycosyltransferase involved in cell wall biosynthesis
VPVIASIGGAEVARLPQIGYGGLLTRRGRLMTSFVLRRASVVTGGSHYVLDRARVLYPSRAYDLAPLPIDASRFRPAEDRSGFDVAAPCLLHAASLIPVKDQATLLRAFAIIVQTIPGATLEIAGEDPLGHREQLVGLAAQLGITTQTRFLGTVAHASMPPRYQASGLFLLSSLHESQALVVLEAAACAVPTVGSAVGVVPDLARDGCVPVPPSDPDALALAAIAYIRDPQRLRAAGDALRRRILAEYDAEPASARFHGIYRKLAKRRGR